MRNYYFHQSSKRFNLICVILIFTNPVNKFTLICVILIFTNPVNKFTLICLILIFTNPAPHPIHFWCRFIDDCLFIFTHGEDKLQEVLHYMNNVHPTIKFTFKYSPTTIDFLDTSIHLGDHGKLFSKVYSKPTDTFPLLDFKSNHPVETKLSIICSQARRYSYQPPTMKTS